jgi:hypothetical protein
MRELVFFLEEESAKTLLQALIPRLLTPHHPVRYVVFEGKQDLERQLERKLKAYINPDASFVILRDKDSSDCWNVKNDLKAICLSAGKAQAIIRIACHEIESWYLADMEAVGSAYAKDLAHYQRKKKFRNPDELGNPVQELKRLIPEYQKIDGSRRIGSFLDVTNTRSRSFSHFISAIVREAV